MWSSDQRGYIRSSLKRGIGLNGMWENGRVWGSVHAARLLLFLACMTAQAGRIRILRSRTRTKSLMLVAICVNDPPRLMEPFSQVFLMALPWRCSPSPLSCPFSSFFYHWASSLLSLVFIYMKRFWPLTSLDSGARHMSWLSFVCLESEFLLCLDLNLPMNPIPRFLW